jgi:hypothetical protein
MRMAPFCDRGLSGSSRLDRSGFAPFPPARVDSWEMKVFKPTFARAAAFLFAFLCLDPASALASRLVFLEKFGYPT